MNRLILKHFNKNDSDKGDRGVLINTSSASATEGQTGQVAYSAVSGAINSMTLPLARDLASNGEFAYFFVMIRKKTTKLILKLKSISNRTSLVLFFWKEWLICVTFYVGLQNQRRLFKCQKPPFVFCFFVAFK